VGIDVGLGSLVVGSAVGVGVEAGVQEFNSKAPARNVQMRYFIQVLLSGKDYTLYDK
jgi:hypothetical protein